MFSCSSLGAGIFVAIISLSSTRNRLPNRAHLSKQYLALQSVSHSEADLL